MKGEKEYSIAKGNNGDSYQTIIPLTKTTYTLSFEAKSTVSGDKIASLLFDGGDGSKNCVIKINGVDTTNGDGYAETTITDSYKRYSITYTLAPRSIKMSVIPVRTTISAGDVTFKNVRLTAGTDNNWGSTTFMIAYLDAHQGETYYARQLEESAWLNAPMVVTNDNFDGIPSNIITDSENHTFKVTIPSGGTKLFFNSNEALVPTVFKQSASGGI
ncbi:glycerophosphoryl diesterphosphodiesterase [Lactobacillus phage phiLdb]|uniref:Glycerophosphoryl diesterphosphodiesterase n=1 Tax=Lactobacillus phage phiLdb TaxID=1399942 RepID=U3PCT1_9CAUD|nr:phosphodiesterase [Lactobacillus phage phiLdb]AGW43698.1 glycerophosphoryl diesterphosphodiesterase [Lactobacillus phage phiLdb]